MLADPPPAMRLGRVNLEPSPSIWLRICVLSFSLVGFKGNLSRLDVFNLFQGTKKEVEVTRLGTI